uniref:Uncharacterized protein LOC111110598 n=1 Tax=Crassostrea virginica TaxID=6565 RepID=A0A8B8BHM2_CRAVI|nr:uncharacterized protein LOC111110598 [Crassostrea virginica]
MTEEAIQGLSNGSEATANQQGAGMDYVPEANSTSLSSLSSNGHGQMAEWGLGLSSPSISMNTTVPLPLDVSLVEDVEFPALPEEVMDLMRRHLTVNDESGHKLQDVEVPPSFRENTQTPTQECAEGFNLRHLFKVQAERT